MNLIKCIMKNSTCYKGTTIGDMCGIVWHDTAAGNPNIKRYVQPYETDANYAEMITLLGKNYNKNDWNHSTRQAGVHFFVGKIADGSVASVQALDLEKRCWGVGKGTKGSLNGVTYGKSYYQFEICDDGYVSKDYFDKVYKEAVELTAYLCKLKNIDPKGTNVINGVTVPTIVCHQDAYKLKLGSNHSDVYGWFNKFGKTMEDVRNDVAALLKTTTVVSTPSTPTVVEAKPTVATSVPTTTSFKAGDLVKLKDGAKYYSGKTIPARIFKENWYVRSVNGSRVVIDKNESNTESICSAVNANDLELVIAAAVLSVDSKVKIITGAVWYTKGTAVPKWAIQDTWIVNSISGNKVVLGKNVKGTNSLMSAIDKKYLTIV